MNAKEYRKIYPYFCTSCSAFNHTLREYCESCGAQNTMRVGEKADYKNKI